MLSHLPSARRRKVFVGAVCCFLFTYQLGCAAHTPRRPHLKTVQPKGKQYRGLPYKVFGKTYYPLGSAKNFSQEGVASWYGPKFHGQLTSNKEVYNMNTVTAAHKTLPFNSQVKVINLENGLETVVRINDRGPFVGDRIIDLSRRAAKQLGIIEKGTARVRLVALESPGDGFPANQAASIIENFSVQVGVFKDPNNASQLEQKVPGSRVESRPKGGERYFRVLVGRFQNFEEASEQMDELRSQGYPEAFIVADKLPRSEATGTSNSLLP